MQALTPALRRLPLAVLAPFFGLALGLAPLPAAQVEVPKAPDSIQLTNGETLHGLIVRQSNTGVTLQLPYGERNIPNKDIVRIRNVDNTEMWYTRILPPGSLPPWRIIANDLRNSDQIKSFDQVPATTIDEGVFRFVPYVSFRANLFDELNIYGDPDDPAGVEIGIYGPARYLTSLRKDFRQFLGGYLTTVDEVRALYSIDLKKDEIRHVGSITIEVTQPTALDAYGAWWISFYNEKKLNKIRLSPAEYKKLTLPVADVLDRKKGIVKMLEYQAAKMLHKSSPTDSSRIFFEGFYRDKEGNFRLYDSNRKTPETGQASN